METIPKLSGAGLGARQISAFENAILFCTTLRRGETEGELSVNASVSATSFECKRFQI